MATRGNTLTFGKSVTNIIGKIAGAVAGNVSGTTYQTVGSSDLTNVAQNDPNLFTYSNGVFTCVKPGSYTVSFYGRGAYNSSGTMRYLYYRMYKNGSIVNSVTSGSTIGTSGYTTTYTATFAKDDTFYITGAVNSGNLAMSIGYIITADS